MGTALTGPTDHHTYAGDDRKPVEVHLDDGRWVPGQLRSWDRDEHGDWSGMVTYRRGPGLTHIDRFPADRIRQVPAS